MIRQPSADCSLCPRLMRFRAENRAAFPDKFNAPVPSFGDAGASFLVVGLAPGLRGANFTGRPFTGDYAGDTLYGALLKYGFAQGTYDARADDDLRLVDCRITNAVRCVPPENKPDGGEMKNCRSFLAEEIAHMPNLKAVLALGRIAHDAVLRASGLRLADYPFAHGALHAPGTGWVLADSYHCSRYNMNTGRLTEPLFYTVFDTLASRLRVAA